MTAGIETPAAKVRDMREMYANGDDMKLIATQLDVSRQTVMRYCLGIYRRKVRKFTNGERSDLLAVWRTA